MTTLTNSFEGGTNGNTITIGTSGGVSGNAFDTVTGPPASGTLAFDSTHAAHGTLACKVATAATAGQDLVRWDSSMGTQATVWFRTYLYFTGNPAASLRVVQFASGGGSLCGNFQVNTSGKILAVDKNGSQQLLTTNSITLNAWVRLEGFITGSATVGQLELKLFNSPDSTTPTETLTSAANLNTLSSMGIYQFGSCTSVANVTAFWQDDIGLSSTGYIGPFVQLGALQGPPPIPPGFLSPASVFFKWQPIIAPFTLTAPTAGSAAASGSFTGSKSDTGSFTGPAAGTGGWRGLPAGPQLIYKAGLDSPVVKPITFASPNPAAPFTGPAAQAGAVASATARNDFFAGRAAAAGTMAGVKTAHGAVAGQAVATSVLNGLNVGPGSISAGAAAAGKFASARIAAGSLRAAAAVSGGAAGSPPVAGSFTAPIAVSGAVAGFPPQPLPVAAPATVTITPANPFTLTVAPGPYPAAKRVYPPPPATYT